MTSMLITIIIMVTSNVPTAVIIMTSKLVANQL